MSTHDLDRLHRDRVRSFVKGYKEPGFDLAKLFLSEKVCEALPADKVLINGLNLPYLLAILPFTPQVFLMTCDCCFSNEKEVQAYLSLLDEDLFVPVLTREYERYPTRVIDAVRRKAHVSLYEFNAWYNLALPALADGMLCKDCVGKHKKEILAHLKGVRGISDVRANIADIFESLIPYVHPDYTLLNGVKKALAPLDRETISQLEGMAQFVRTLRLAQVWKGAIPLGASELEGLPRELEALTGNAPFIAAGLRQQVADGLGLRLPTDIPISRYAELVREFRPRILRVMGGLVSGEAIARGSFADVAKEIARINDEIARIKNLRRFVIIEAAVEVFDKHKSLMAAGLAMGALGLPAGGIPGCLTGVGIGAASAKIGKAVRKRLKSGGGEPYPKVARAGTIIHRDLQPVVETAMSIYLSSDTPTIGVMSLREQLASETKVASSRR